MLTFQGLAIPSRQVGRGFIGRLQEIEPVLAAFAKVTTVTTESDVAEAVYRAANDRSGQLRFPAGADAVALARSAASVTAVTAG